MTAENATSAPIPQEVLPSGWYALRLVAAFSQLEEVRAWGRAWEGGKFAAKVDDGLDQLGPHTFGACSTDVGEGWVLVIEKLPGGSAVCMLTRRAARAGSPGEAFENAAHLRVLNFSSTVIRLCSPSY